MDSATSHQTKIQRSQGLSQGLWVYNWTFAAVNFATTLLFPCGWGLGFLIEFLGRGVRKLHDCGLWFGARKILGGGLQSTSGIM